MLNIEIGRLVDVDRDLQGQIDDNTADISELFGQIEALDNDLGDLRFDVFKRLDELDDKIKALDTDLLDLIDDLPGIILDEIESWWEIF